MSEIVLSTTGNIWGKCITSRPGRFAEFEICSLALSACCNGIMCVQLRQPCAYLTSIQMRHMNDSFAWHFYLSVVQRS